MRLERKKIILGITGSIAAYKAVVLLRLLIKEGAEVQIVITPSGKKFITPITLAAISGKPVISQFFGSDDGTWHSHIDLGLWADVMIIAPATANTIGKMAGGIADNILITTYISAKCPVLIAPAMDSGMFIHPSITQNIATLKKFGNIIIDPVEGQLASGLKGKGRMQEPEIILEELIKFFERKKKLLNKKFLVSAGPTYEKIDPVRFIGNYSSGKMGFAIAEELTEKGAEVILVSGPVSITTQNKKIRVIRVESAMEMYQSCIKYFPECNGAVMTAAVADFSPEKYESQKKKRGSKTFTLNLVPTKDIAAALGEIKTNNQILVGFALENNNEIENAKKKIIKKKLDFIVLNSLKEEGAGFGKDTNKITIIDKYNNREAFELKSKREVAEDIVKKMISLIR
jgi:phosphopantothenoylcysteine decarboxylase / phosphopantothenate---cysteine ligase